MPNSFIRNFTSFQKKRNVESEIENPIQESVKVINDRFIVGGIELKQSMINSYVKKVKDATGQDLNNTFSKSEIAEQLINYLVDKHGDVDNIPPAALLGGEEEMVDQVDEISMEEDDVIVDEETIEDVVEDDLAEEGSEDAVEDEEANEFAEEEDADVDFSELNDDEFKDIEDEENLDTEEEVAEEDILDTEEEDEGESEEEDEDEGEEDDLPL